MELDGDLATVSKPSKALRLILDATALLLNEAQTSNPKNSAHQEDNAMSITSHQALEMLVHAREETLQILEMMSSEKITAIAHDTFFGLLEHEFYDPVAAAKEGGAIVSQLAARFALLQRTMLDDHAKDRRTLATASFCILIDGSRKKECMSLFAAELHFIRHWSCSMRCCTDTPPSWQSSFAPYG
jgi:hypothetical protein